jgi:hypothetical protein
MPPRQMQNWIFKFGSLSTLPSYPSLWSCHFHQSPISVSQMRPQHLNVFQQLHPHIQTLSSVRSRRRSQIRSGGWITSTRIKTEFPISTYMGLPKPSTVPCYCTVLSQPTISPCRNVLNLKPRSFNPPPRHPPRPPISTFYVPHNVSAEVFPGSSSALPVSILLYFDVHASPELSPNFCASGASHASPEFSPSFCPLAANLSAGISLQHTSAHQQNSACVPDSTYRISLSIWNVVSGRRRHRDSGSPAQCSRSFESQARGIRVVLAPSFVRRNNAIDRTTYPPAQVPKALAFFVVVRLSRRMEREGEHRECSIEVASAFSFHILCIKVRLPLFECREQILEVRGFLPLRIVHNHKSHCFVA